MPRHGLSNSGAYSSWRNMKARCNNPNDPKFKHYGGRGITVCDRWSSFQNFYEDMGERPNGHSIDRINNDLGYEPGNCQWIDMDTNRAKRWIHKAGNHHRIKLELSEELVGAVTDIREILQARNAKLGSLMAVTDAEAIRYAIAFTHKQLTEVLNPEDLDHD